MDGIKKFLGVGEYDPFRKKEPKPLSPEDLEKVKQLLRQGTELQAIQYYQMLTDCDLHDASVAVRRLRIEEQLAHPYAAMEWIPEKCPECGAPLDNDNVRWVNAGLANCPYCGARLKEPEEEE